MRPVTIELEGFGAFRDRTVVDLADTDLFAIVGATGHGKSTLIDAICFALYGRVPRHGAGEIAPVITLGANEAKVSFTFDLGPSRYVAARLLRRDKSGAKTRAVRLETVVESGPGQVLAGSVREFDAAVEHLVGLDFDQFTKCVVLPQGRFAEFLHAPAGERTAILSTLLDLGRYDRMAAEARKQATEAAGRRSVFEQERERAGAVTVDDVAAARGRLDALTALQRDVDTAAPHDARLAAEIEAAAADTAAARRAEAALAAVLVPAAVRDAAAAAREAAAALATVAETAEQAETEAAELEARRDRQVPIEALSAALEAHGERATVAERVTRGETVHAERAAEAERARDALVSAQDALTTAEMAHDDAQQQHAHVELRRALVAGEPCPVCEQVVSKVPRVPAASTIAKRREELDARRAAFKQAEGAAQAALAELHKADALLTTLRERLSELDARLAEHPDREQVATRLEEARAVHASAAEARKAAIAQRAAARAAEQQLQGTRDSLRRAESVFAGQRDALVSAGLEPPGPAEGDLAHVWDALAAWAADTRPEYEKRAAELDDVARGQAAERDALLHDIVERAAALGVEVRGAASVAAAAPAIAAATRDADHAVSRAEERLARAAELDTMIAAERDREVVAADLGRLLDKRHFGQWLVDEALRGLVGGASGILERLSAGQYALTASGDGELLVVDHVNADETRSVRSLSGGETFQASLALALALAGRIAELARDGAARLESIFLDEGFGTLDPETLDVVAGTIESLGHGDRIVGIVTHVAELAERMPTRLRVRKQGRTAVVTREDA